MWKVDCNYVLNLQVCLLLLWEKIKNYVLYRETNQQPDCLTATSVPAWDVCSDLNCAYRGFLAR